MNYASSKPINDIIEQVSVDITEKKIEGTAIKLGFKSFDEFKEGFYPGELVVIGSRPSMDKLLLMGQLALTTSIDKPTLYFSYASSPDCVLKIMVAFKTQIPLHRIIKSELTDDEKDRVAQAISELKKHHLFFNEYYRTSVKSLINECEQQIAENKVKVIVIDTIQLITSNEQDDNGNRQYTNRDLELTYILQELKKFARKKEVVLFLVSELKRSEEMREGDKQPNLSDLQDNGVVEPKIDKVLLLYRPEYYGVLMDESGSTNRLVKMILAKNNKGYLSTFRLEHNKSFTRLIDELE